MHASLPHRRCQHELADRSTCTGHSLSTSIAGGGPATAGTGLRSASQGDVTSAAQRGATAALPAQALGRNVRDRPLLGWPCRHVACIPAAAGSLVLGPATPLARGAERVCRSSAQVSKLPSAFRCRNQSKSCDALYTCTELPQDLNSLVKLWRVRRHLQGTCSPEHAPQHGCRPYRTTKQTCRPSTDTRNTWIRGQRQGGSLETVCAFDVVGTAGRRTMSERRARRLTSMFSRVGARSFQEPPISLTLLIPSASSSPHGGRALCSSLSAA